MFSIFINSFSVFKPKSFKRFVAVCETAGQYGVFLVLTTLIHWTLYKLDYARTLIGSHL